MTAFLLSALCALCALVLIAGLIEKGGAYRIQFLLVGTVVGFVLPQAFGLLNDVTVPDGALDMTLLMGLLCMVALTIGASFPTTPFRAFSWTLSESRLTVSAAVLTLVGAYFRLQLRHLPHDADLGTGTPVILAFFANNLSYGFALAVWVFARNGSRSALAVASIGALFELERIVLLGRRRTLFEFAFTILLAYWFAKKWAVPKWLVLAALVVAALLIPSTGKYRHLMRDEEGPQWSEVGQISVIDNMKDDVLEEGGSELRSACYAILAAETVGEYDLGTCHWNEVVFNYVPAQLLGADFKDSLMFAPAATEEDVLGFAKPVGSTYTGFTGVFKSFWYFGCLEFLLIGAALAKIYRGATSGHSVAQLLYMLSVVPAMHTITHQTQRLFSLWINLVIFVLPFVYFSREKRASGVTEASEGASNAEKRQPQQPEAR